MTTLTATTNATSPWAISADTTGTIVLQSNGITAVTIDTSQNASFAKSIILSGSTSGTTTLASTAVAGTSTATLPAATGTVMVSGNMPAFSVYKSNALGTQIIAAATYTKITFDVKDFDTNTNFSSSRFTPTVAGYYQINGLADLGGNGFCFVGLFKNGAEIKRGSGASVASEFYSSVSSVVYLNGTTDYIELYAFINAGASPSVYASASGQYPYFNGCLVRAA